MRKKSIVSVVLMIIIILNKGNLRKSDSKNLERLEKNEVQNVFITESSSVISPSGNYKAFLEKFDDNGVISFKIRIQNNSDNNEYIADIVLRARDSNFALWSDEGDVLWCYSGDIGVFLWALDDNGEWLKYSYTDNNDFIVPRALIEMRPNSFE